jgi:amino-acid N-acetyltransferase
MINFYASKGLMLPRPLSSIYEHIRDFFVYAVKDDIVACAALHVCWEDLAEIRALAVQEGYDNKGIGSRLVQSCLEEACQLLISKVFCLTYTPQFFEKFGFRIIDKNELPKKIWGDCINCIKFPDCKEEAMIIELNKVSK